MRPVKWFILSGFMEIQEYTGIAICFLGHWLPPLSVFDIAILPPSVSTWAGPVWNKRVTIKAYATFPDLIHNRVWICSFFLPSVIPRPIFVSLWETELWQRSLILLPLASAPFHPLPPEQAWWVADKFLLMIGRPSPFAFGECVRLVCLLLQC